MEKRTSRITRIGQGLVFVGAVMVLGSLAQESLHFALSGLRVMALGGPLILFGAALMVYGYYKETTPPK